MFDNSSAIVIKERQHILRAVLSAGYDVIYRNVNLFPHVQGGEWYVVSTGSPFTQCMFLSSSVDDLLKSCLVNKTISEAMLGRELIQELNCESGYFTDTEDLERIVQVLSSYIKGFHNASKFPDVKYEVDADGEVIFKMQDRWTTALKL